MVLMLEQLGRWNRSMWEGLRSDSFLTPSTGADKGKAVGEKMFWGGLVPRFRWKVRVLLQLPKLAILNQQ